MKKIEELKEQETKQMLEILHENHKKAIERDCEKLNIIENKGEKNKMELNVNLLLAIFVFLLLFVLMILLFCTSFENGNKEDCVKAGFDETYCEEVL